MNWEPVIGLEIHVQLATDKLVQELLVIGVGEYLYGQLQLSFKFIVEYLHEFPR